MDVTEEGIVIEIKLVQYLNVLFLIVVINGGIITLVNERHESKAYSPIVVTDGGIDILSK